jgi:hypothetical protein
MNQFAKTEAEHLFATRNSSNKTDNELSPSRPITVQTQSFQCMEEYSGKTTAKET